MSSEIMGVVDTHTHLDSKEYDQDRDEVIARASAAGVSRIITIGAGYGFESASNACDIADKFPFVFATVGLHPHDAGGGGSIDELRKLASHPKVVAIGETGLDFFRDFAPKDEQERWFIAQIQLAREVKKPLVIHSREAGEECIKVLKANKAHEVGGVFHCYSEDENFAARLREIGFLVSFPGSLTFKKNDNLREIAKRIPLEQIMVETDAPYLSPEPYRGKRCESAFVVETYKRLAEVKGLPFEEVALATTKTACSFFKIP